MKTLLMILMLSLIFGCGVRVKTHWGFMGPSTYEATDGKVSVYYYNGDCCCVAKEVLQGLADKANRGELDWSKMSDEKFKRQMLRAECDKLDGK